MKIYQSILDSSVWSESQSTRLVWITMLTMADWDGRVFASVDGIARRAVVSIDEATEALAVLSSPDANDRSGVEEGRRIVQIERGWRVINHSYYRDLRTEKQVKTAERVAAWRASKRTVTGNRSNGTKHEVRADRDPDRYLIYLDPLSKDLKPDRDLIGGVQGRVASQTVPVGPGQSRETPPAATPQRKGRKSSAPSWRRFPADWPISDDCRELALRLGVDLAAEHAKILDHEFQKAHSDAPATFRTWLRRAAELRSVHSANGRSVAPGLEEYNLTKQRQGEEFAQRQLARMRRQQ